MSQKDFDENEELRIEVASDESDFSDTQSSFSDTTSLTSSVFNYVYENGRRYTSNRSQSGEYVLPNDEQEQERLDMFHHLFSLMLRGELLLGPFKEEWRGQKKRILDLGTGTGIWAIDVGDHFPEWEVLGTDLSPIQPRWVPPNVRFEIDDYELDWIFPQKFDLIHTRSLMGAVRDWPALFRKMYDNLVPGGYIEIHEGCNVGAFSEDGSHKGTALVEYNEALKQAGIKSGMRMDLYHELGNYIKDAGFVNFSEKKLKLPVGPWPKDPHFKEIGIAGQEVGNTALEAYGLAIMTRVLGWPLDKTQDLIQRATKDFHNKRLHIIYPHSVFIAQKPLDA
ncbi:S-adenosyl-L-methionine-dependent methyltransferase [Ascobolus immersus RN42]|uniref:S-adenosyl-L-methionine-dependent methyltransferase n=1 Tax=Ascobolus immersus RN42 TaxID=1160509 RepID=A0A3N4HUY5_ASCIM|nr:S-adenosyl-L-methionine-dependent methyltransferase [Ascobolus immersus RN42]